MEKIGAVFEFIVAVAFGVAIMSVASALGSFTGPFSAGGFVATIGAILRYVSGLLGV